MLLKKVFTYLLLYTGHCAGVWKRSAVWALFSESSHCSVGGGATQITSVPRVQLLCEIHASCYGKSLTGGFSNRISELFLETKKLSNRRSRGRAFHLENSLKADTEGWDKIMQGTSSNSISESLITGPIYTYVCPSLPLPLLWFIQRKSNVFILVIDPANQHSTFHLS